MNMLTAKDETRRQWNQTPCGTGDFLGRLEYATLDWFDEVRRSRYEVTDRWMKRLIPWECCRGGKLLEIGHGIGSDLLTWAEHGALCHGIDITEEHHRLCRRNFGLHGRHADLALADAAEIPHESRSFDLVYSNGVLHHTPDTVRCVGEAYRVLKPGGLFILTLYHTWSLVHARWLLVQGLLRGQWRRLGYRKLLATIEHGADGQEVAPLVKTYGARAVRHMLADFRDVRLTSAGAGRMALPRAIEDRLGWYLVAFARK
jgi:ubiquinone/menaquinone biosynthesis C-methylase UbiE